MKKLIILSILFLLFSYVLFSQAEIFYNSTPTLQWDAVTTDGDGNPILPEDTITYGVYIWDTANGDIQLQPIGDLTFFGMTTDTELILSFPYRANWAAAVNTILTDGDSNVIYSDLAYTVEEPPVTATGPFVYVPNSSALPPPQGLKDSGI